MCFMPKPPAINIISQPGTTGSELKDVEAPPVETTADKEEVVSDVTGGSSPTPVPEIQDLSVQMSKDRERRRRLRLGAENTTLVTGGQGVAGQAATGGKQLLGQ